GAMAYFTGADDSGDFTADDNQGNAFVHLPSSGTILVDVVDASDHTTLLNSTDNITVALGAKGSTSYTITVSAGTRSGTADGDYIILDGSVGLSPMGIRGIIDDGNPPGLTGGLQGLAVASHGYWKAQVFTGATAGTKEDLTLARMQEPLSAIATNSDFDESDVKFLLSNYNVRDKYVSLLVSEKRFVNTMKLDGGFTGVEFNGIPLVVDPQCDRSKIWYVVPESLRIFRTSDFDWMDKDGAVLNRVANKDAYEAVLFHYGNLGTIARNACAVLEDITD
ncbi:MAG TPA: phage major capsid protein, partial [bacterium]|nr:phage major capsid protein [bacterium]